MLMDEPFGAIDPINRERLQNEFLRLQAEIRKTIIFVTHDIDEAIKMGDRIAILKQGGKLAQYATPAELLMAPADDFVEDFVGADRALKRLALMRVRDIDLWEAPLAFVGQPTAEVRAKLDGRGGPACPRGRLRAAAARLALGARPARPRRFRSGPTPAPEPVLDLEDVMRDALSDLLQTETQYAPVIDGQGRDRRRAVGRDHLRVPRLARGQGRGARRRRAAARLNDSALAQVAALLARSRSTTGPAATRAASPQNKASARAGRRQLRPLHDPLLKHLLLVLESRSRSAS